MLTEKNERVRLLILETLRDDIIAELKERLETKTMPTVICPKHTCGCGLCAPKSAYKENFKDVLYNHVDSSVFENSMKEVPNAAPIIPTAVK